MVPLLVHKLPTLHYWPYTFHAGPHSVKLGPAKMREPFGQPLQIDIEPKTRFWHLWGEIANIHILGRALFYGFSIH